MEWEDDSNLFDEAGRSLKVDDVDDGNQIPCSDDLLLMMWQPVQRSPVSRSSANGHGKSKSKNKRHLKYLEVMLRPAWRAIVALKPTATFATVGRQ